MGFSSVFHNSSYIVALTAVRSGYIVFGSIVGISYEKITHVIPAFIILYGVMQFILGLGGDYEYKLPLRVKSQRPVPDCEAPAMR